MSESTVILLVEDDLNDAFFFSRALTQLGFQGHLEHVKDIDTAKAYLAGVAPFQDRVAHPPAEMIIADSAVAPRGSGVDLLEWQRANGINLPFVIFTGGIEPELRERAEAAGVRRVVTKPSNYRDMAEKLRDIVSELPAHRRLWLK